MGEADLCIPLVGQRRYQEQVTSPAITPKWEVAPDAGCEHNNQLVIEG